jgi:SAM-dependent methyltransferase
MTVVALHESGPPERRLDLLLLGDGFTEAELPRFRYLAARVTQAVLTTEPFASHQGRLNVWRRDLVSEESGISERGRRRRTALAARHDFLSPHAIGSLAWRRLRRARAGVPGDVVMVLANSARRGGWALPFTRVGWVAFPRGDAGDAERAPFAAPPLDPSYPGSAEDYAVDTFLHELGHACAGLADEYAVDLPAHVGSTAAWFQSALWVAGFAERRLGLAAFPNTTFRPERPPWRGPVVEGALGLHRGAYRSAERCKMRAERDPFCAVCREAIRRRALDRFAPEEPAVHSDARRRAYDATVTAYRLAFLPLWKLFGRGHQRWAIDRLRALGATSVLDAGTGTGFWARIAARALPRASVVGVDFSPRYLEVARREPARANLRFELADLAALPDRAGRYDAIICSRVLDTIPARAATLRELRRVLRPGGELLLFLKGRSAWPDRILASGVGMILGRAPGRLWHDAPLHRSLDMEAKAHGFAVVDLHQTALMTRAALRAI